MAWSTSDRGQRLPSNWLAIRRAVKARAGGKCQEAAHAPHCVGIGTDADHIEQGDNHDLSNLQWLSRPCHDAKTARETAARNRQTAALKRRPVEQHPGQRTTA
jgi:5-methylcytosine-specific restriction endonuclease McrA